MNKKIILASASPRRRELLTQIGLDFDVVVSETEEKINSTEPAKVVEEPVSYRRRRKRCGRNLRKVVSVIRNRKVEKLL